ncbi:cobalt ABC transporter permease CbiQ [Mycolicibacterium mageritense DSM 44476 = CIP 104973]|uniref:ABC transporter n=1 Tax=Mycolicibacterium mageritense TaxID=53462 RepID=A0ABN5XZX4_MYCME|nr:energy-coupling factor transporter transmembrane component T [Mycolicibacterium mageritense]MCC9181995.1 energy-coupling factor transporter transmembrane protein EcfT [Mycolicibacterium mageritense]BBX31573.1 ABC transporter [Mycolicibacterium mageritense]GJJ23870.1 ABC transporter [Mycolicibacterium mageritense]CDO23876.1 cobalt ABC transporter permease CbiQ [Mycolicibacterium mageritense DSM 44476 = CIP 104973]
MNPVAKLITAAVIALALVLSVDWVSALTALVLEIPLFLALGVRLRPLVVRGGLVTVAAALTALTNLLYGEVRGTVYWHFLLINVSEGSVQLALAMFLRVLAIALPSVLLFADVQATELADGLGQVLRLPARFVVGALAGMRLVGLLHQDWQYLGYARRARGVADHGRLRRFLGQAFALLVFAIRRGTKLATAMEARGFGAYPTRTWARPSTFGVREFLLIAAGFAIAGAAIGVSVAFGAWQFIGR